jgi:peptide/nickel transport system substrate-binding protein
MTKDNKGIYTIALMIFIIAYMFISLNDIQMVVKPAMSLFNPINNEHKKLVVGRANDSVSLDPAIVTEMDSFKVTVNIFETLVKYEKDQGEIIPCLAESWKCSEDGLIWSFKLRRGVKFHDGTPFDAHAVVFNFNRWMDRDNPYHNNSFRYWNYIFGGFPGFIKSVKALSDYFLEIKLSKPYAPFLNALAMPAFGIASPEAIKESNGNLYDNPIGTGPFIFKKWEKNKSLFLERNDNYWSQIAKINELEFRVIPSSKDRLEELKQGNIHIADFLSMEDIEDIKFDPNLHLYLRPSFNVGYLSMNNEKYPFNKREVRMAINHAIDKERLITEVFNNMAKPAITYLPPSLWGYNENLEVYEYNPEKAKELLKEAGFPEGFKTTLWVMDASREYLPKPLETAQFIKESLKKIGIRAEIMIFTWNQYIKKMHNGEHDMALIGWTGDYADPDNFLYTMLSSENAKPGLAGNYSFYKNSNVDQLLIQARQTSNMFFRRSLYRSVQEIVNYDAPSVPLVHTMPALAAILSVKEYTPYMTGIESLENVYIETE